MKRRKGRKMKEQINLVIVLTAIAVVLVPSSFTAADDLNPPPYRGDPLSVYAHWNLLPGTVFLDLTNWSSTDDSDPATYLYPNFTPTPQIQPNGDIYQLQLPNWVDKEPVKYMRLQLTWQNSTQPPVNVFSEGLDGANLISGLITYTSPLFPNAATGSTYQYYDFAFYPNPDFERIHVQVAPNALLSQVVVDSVSTIPEPATVLLLAIGGIFLKKTKR